MSSRECFATPCSRSFSRTRESSMQHLEKTPDGKRNLHIHDAILGGKGSNHHTSSSGQPSEGAEFSRNTDTAVRKTPLNSCSVSKRPLLYSSGYSSKRRNVIRTSPSSDIICSNNDACQSKQSGIFDL